MMSEQANQEPKLRFPEFEGEWEIKRLGDIASFSKGKGISKSEIDANGKIECIRYGELYTYYSEVIINILSKTNIDPLRLILSEYNDVIIPASGETPLDIATASCVLKKNVAIGGDLNIIRSLVQGIFLSYYLNNKRKKDIARLSQGNSIVHLYAHQLKTLHLNIPTLKEQQKIADFLTAVDKRTHQLEKKKRLLTEYKKGVMQQIFSQQIRFTDNNGNPYPDWQEKRLGDVVSLKMTNSLSRSALNYETGQVFNIHYGDIHTKFKSNFHIDKEDVPYINYGINLSRIAANCYCRVGDLIIADASEDYKDIGKSIEIIKIDGKQLLAGLHTYLARPEGDNVAVGFLGYLMQARYVRLQIMRFAQGISILGISKGNIGKVIVQIPIVEEQQKIASFLTSIDKKIEQVSAQCEQTKEFKKGLLQQMFV